MARKSPPPASEKLREQRRRNALAKWAKRKSGAGNLKAIGRAPRGVSVAEYKRWWREKRAALNHARKKSAAELDAAQHCSIVNERTLRRPIFKVRGTDGKTRIEYFDDKIPGG